MEQAEKKTVSYTIISTKNPHIVSGQYRTLGLAQ